MKNESLYRERNDARAKLETKTREWMTTVSTCDNLKEQLRRCMGDLGAVQAKVAKIEEFPSADELSEWFTSGYGEPVTEYIAEHYASVGNGIRVLREKLAERLGAKSPIVETDPDLKPPARGLRQRFIEATKALGKEPYGRDATMDDLFTLIALIDK